MWHMRYAGNLDPPIGWRVTRASQSQSLTQRIRWISSQRATGRQNSLRRRKRELLSGRERPWRDGVLLQEMEDASDRYIYITDLPGSGKGVY